MTWRVAASRELTHMRLGAITPPCLRRLTTAAPGGGKLPNVPLSPLQRIAVTVGAAVGSIVNPTRGDWIASLGEATGAYCRLLWRGATPLCLLLARGHAPLTTCRA